MEFLKLTICKLKIFLNDIVKEFVTKISIISIIKMQNIISTLFVLIRLVLEKSTMY